MMASKVTVIIPTYNRAHLLSDSVGSVISQGYDPLEVIVVDDGSTDDTQEVVNRFGSGVRYLRQEKSGVSTARNLGILHATGDYLIFLDSDDVLLPGAVARLAEALDSHPECGAAYCGWIETDGPGSVYKRSPLTRPSGTVFVEMCTEFISVVHSIMIRRDCVARAGMFDTRLSRFEDMDFNIRVAAYFPWIFLPEHLVEYRRWNTGLSTIDTDLDEARILYMEKMSAYKRAGMLSNLQWLAIRQHIMGPVYTDTSEAELALRYRRNWLAFRALANAVRCRPVNAALPKTWWLVLRCLAGGVRRCIGWCLRRLGVVPEGGARR